MEAAFFLKDFYCLLVHLVVDFQVVGIPDERRVILCQVGVIFLKNRLLEDQLGGVVGKQVGILVHHLLGNGKVGKDVRHVTFLDYTAGCLVAGDKHSCCDGERNE